jgi:hypothetical protein
MLDGVAEARSCTLGYGLREAGLRNGFRNEPETLAVYDGASKYVEMITTAHD